MAQIKTTHQGPELAGHNYGKIACLLRQNIDTDQIIPKQFLKSIERTGFGNYLFDSWRFTESGLLGMLPHEREINPDFELNQPEARGARFLLTGENFGCGSSREHAVWALQQYGFCAIIAPSFAEIFADNALRNGLALIEIDSQSMGVIERFARQGSPGFCLDLLGNQLIGEGLTSLNFNLPQQTKDRLISGKDDIAISLEFSEQIQQWEKESQEKTPWLWVNRPS